MTDRSALQSKISKQSSVSIKSGNIIKVKRAKKQIEDYTKNTLKNEIFNLIMNKNGDSNHTMKRSASNISLNNDNLEGKSIIRSASMRNFKCNPIINVCQKTNDYSYAANSAINFIIKNIKPKNQEKVAKRFENTHDRIFRSYNAQNCLRFGNNKSKIDYELNYKVNNNSTIEIERKNSTKIRRISIDCINKNTFSSNGVSSCLNINKKYNKIFNENDKINNRTIDQEAYQYHNKKTIDSKIISNKEYHFNRKTGGYFN